MTIMTPTLLDDLGILTDVKTAAWELTDTMPINIDFGGSPGACPPIIEKRPRFHQLLPPLSPHILASPNIFDNSTPVTGPYLLLVFEDENGDCNHDDDKTEPGVDDEQTDVDVARRFSVDDESSNISAARIGNV